MNTDLLGSLMPLSRQADCVLARPAQKQARFADCSLISNDSAYSPHRKQCTTPFEQQVIPVSYKDGKIRIITLNSIM